METEQKLKKEERCEICEDDYEYPLCRCTNCDMQVHWDCVKNELGGDESVSCPHCPGVIYK